MNIYFVVSDPLPSVDCTMPDDYCIAELVRAKSRGQAKSMAWKKDMKGFVPWGGMAEMPKFQTRLRERDVEGEAAILERGSYPEEWWIL